MIVDSSAVVAIARGERDAKLYFDVLKSSALSFMAAPTYLELCMVVIGARPAETENEVLALLDELSIKVIGFTPEMAEVAVKAYLRYGKGRSHPAQLNFGDCIAYATSKVEAMPLLFKGDDFRLTDVECAI